MTGADWQLRGPELLQALGRLMSEISEECYGAGWLGGTEYLVPELCRRAIAHQRAEPWGHGEVSPQRARQLMALAQQLGHWADLDEPGVGYFTSQAAIMAVRLRCHMDRPDRTTRKREAQAYSKRIEELAVQLVGMSQAQLDALPLDKWIRAAIAEAQRLTVPSAIHRQVRHVAGLLRVDAEEIWHALGQGGDVRERLFVKLDRGRSKLLTGGKAELEEVLLQYPSLERQHLRQLVRNAVKEQDNPARSKAEKRLFAYLREAEESSDG